MSRSEVISARFAPHEKALVQAAAAVERRLLSEYVHANLVALACKRVSALIASHTNEGDKPKGDSQCQ